MANSEHLAVLEKGVEAWNQWRDVGGVESPDLSGADLAKAELVGARFDKAYLIGANLSASDLTGADLSGANLTRVDLSGAELADANLSGATLTGANLSGAFLCAARLVGTNLSEADLTGAELAGADLTKTYLAGADITGADMTGADLTGANVMRLRYSRRAMRGKYNGTLGIDSCHSNPIFKRDAHDQQYIDAVAYQSRRGWRRILFRMWALTDFGRSMPGVAVFALLLVVAFGTVYAVFPSLLHYDEHSMTPFSPFYFSLVTYTTLGFGDVHAGCLAGEILVAFEVVLGYLTLGMLLAILANTVARRS
jgi:hypothetical protein